MSVSPIARAAPDTALQRADAHPGRAPSELALLDVRGVAELLGMSPRTIYVLVGRGELGVFRIGRSLRFSRAHVREFLDACEDARG